MLALRCPLTAQPQQVDTVLDELSELALVLVISIKVSTNFSQLKMQSILPNIIQIATQLSSLWLISMFMNMLI